MLKNIYGSKLSSQEIRNSLNIFFKYFYDNFSVMSIKINKIFVITLLISNILCYEFSPYTNMSVQNVLKEIKDLDNSLLDMFINTPKGAGSIMLKYLKRYVWAMKEMVFYTYENKTKMKIEANDLIEQVGPAFMEHPFDKEKIRENFEWESKEYDAMYDLRLKTVKVWNDFQDNF